MALVRRRATRFAGQRRPRRRSVWGDLNGANGGLSISANTNIAFQPLVSLETKAAYNIIGSTVVRMIGHVDVVDVPAGAFNWHVGIIVTSDTVEADDIDPELDPFLDWMFLQHECATSATGIQTWHSPKRIEFDLRSKRRLDEAGDGLFLCVKNQGASSHTFYVSCRTLVLLP